MTAVKKTDEQYVRVPFCTLTPETPSPCNIYVHFRGKYIEAIKEGSLIKVDFLAKMKQEDNHFCYVKESTKDNVLKFKNTQESLPNSINEKSPNLIKISDYLGYGKKNIRYLEQNTTFQEIQNKVEEALRISCNNPMLSWFFEKTYENHDLFFHSSRLTHLIAHFVLSNSIIEDKEIPTLLSAAICHEVGGDPNKTNRVPSRETIDYIDQKKIILPKDVLSLIATTDEFIDGSGFPDKIKGDKLNTSARILSLVNRFDHVRMKIGGTRRIRFEQTKALLEKEKSRFDGIIYAYFWNFLNDIEILQ